MHAQLFPRALGSWVLASLLVSPIPTHAGNEPKESLTLAKALALALAKSPELAASAAERSAREAHARQAGLLPNPELRAEMENVGGSGDRQGFEETETTVGLSQLLETAGKRGKRRHVARLDAELAGFDHESRKLAVLSATTKAFVRALAARQRLRLATELEQLANDGVDAMRAQVAAGAAPAVEVARARVTLGKSTVVLRRAEHDLRAAETALAATWGGDRLAPFELEGELTPARSLPGADAIDVGSAEGPDVVRWGTELEERRAAVAMEEAARIPDVTVGAAGRHFSDNGDNALVFDLSVPLPIFNRNQGAIAEARHRLDKARAEREAAAASIRAAIAATRAELTAAHEQAMRLRDEVIPEAQRAFEGARAAYRQGAFRSVDVLDAQRTLFELRADYVTALETFHVQAAELDRLTGRFPSVAAAQENGR
jgi:cobalt-zinc-cadmium efflux system outer membrane protein